VARFYITTPIYYVNDAPHVGHAYTMVIADALARWHRLLGDDVFFLTGTDEHGDKIARAAQSHGVDPQQWVDAMSSRFVDAWVGIEVSNDDFIRTTEDRHRRAVQRFLGQIHDNGYTELGVYRGLYCVACEDYKKEADLVDGNCAIHGTPVELLEEENYFFKLSAFTDRLLEYYEANPDVVRPVSKRNEALGIIKGGLEDISITRTSTRWGVEVPWDQKHVFYVWYDALVNYLTAIGYGDDDERFERWWPAVHHLIGKDIIRFHCVWWPAMCMAAGIDPPAHLLVHGWLLSSGAKMSKSGANQVAPRELAEDFGVDALRYFLLRDTPFGLDGDFSYEGITTRYNADLANNLGNLMSRVATVVASKCGGIGPAADPDSRLRAVADGVVADASRAWQECQPHAALDATWRLVHETNAELEATEPWKAEPSAEVDAVLGSALEVLRIVAVLASPAIPATAAEMWRRLGLSGRPEGERLPGAASWGGYPGGLPVEKADPLFPRRNK
jgi:methionyl-tRNA synthetase